MIGGIENIPLKFHTSQGRYFVNTLVDTKPTTSHAKLHLRAQNTALYKVTIRHLQKHLKRNLCTWNFISIVTSPSQNASNSACRHCYKTLRTDIKRTCSSALTTSVGCESEVLEYRGLIGEDVEPSEGLGSKALGVDISAFELHSCRVLVAKHGSLS